MLTIDCVVPYVEITQSQDDFFGEIDVTAISLSPQMAYLDATDV